MQAEHKTSASAGGSAARSFKLDGPAEAQAASVFRMAEAKQVPAEGKTPASRSKTNKKPAPKPPKTPRTARELYNFAAASSRDGLVFGSERPGHVQPSRDRPSTPRGPLVPDSQVGQWIDHMKAKGVCRVLCLLNPQELAFFANDLLGQYRAHFKNVAHTTLVDPDALGIVMEARGKPQTKSAID